MTRPLRVALVCLFGCGLLASCRDATQVTASIRTNVPYRDGLRTGVWTSTTGRFEGAAQADTQDPWLGDGSIGDLVVTPRASRDEPLRLRVVMGLGRDPATCTQTDAKGCIVARRILSFVAHKALRVPVVLHLACDGVACDEDSTCNYLGKCVPAQVDPAGCVGDGCVLPGDEAVTGVATSDASTDARESEVSGDAGVADTASDADAPVLDPQLPVELSAGLQFTCARFAGGAVKCWGENTTGQLGVGDTQDRGSLPNQMGANLPAVPLGLGRKAIGLATGAGHACALLDDRSIKCWGQGALGELGNGAGGIIGDSPASLAQMTTVNLGTGRSAKSVAAGYDTTCAVLDNDTVKCWGSNNGGQLGQGDSLTRGNAPNQMGDALPAVSLFPIASPVLQVSVGESFACAVIVRGTRNSIYCWGANLNGQLGLGDSAGRGDNAGEMGANLPEINFGTSPASYTYGVAAGFDFTCAVQSPTGVVKCWGGNSKGQLGQGDSAIRGTQPNQLGDSLPPISLGTGVAATQVVTREQTVCARLASGQVKCWGQNPGGVLGQGVGNDLGLIPSDMGDNLVPIPLGTGRTVQQVVVGLSHACALLDNAQVKCWGQSTSGQGGRGDTDSRGGVPGELGDTLPALTFW